MSGVLHGMTAVSVGTNVDPYWSNVLGLLKFEGTNGSTTITDSSGRSGWTSTATLSTTQKKFGSSSLYLDTTTDCRKAIACNLDGNVAFTCEGWVYPTDVTTDEYRTIFSTRTAGIFAPFQLFQHQTKFSILIGNGGGWAVNTLSTNAVFTANTWHHVAVVGDGTNIKIYVAGVLQETYTHYNWSYGSVPIAIGTPVDSGGFGGYIDECRLTVGTARYSESFTPPTAEFPSQTYVPVTSDTTTTVTATATAGVSVTRPVTVVGTPNSAAGTSVTIPGHAVGDIIVIFAYRDGSNTIPSKPAASGTVPAWSDIDAANGANTTSSRTAYFIATATNHTSGTWTNATGMVAAVLRGQAASPIGGKATSGGTSSTSAVAPAVTLSNATGASALLHFFGHRTVTAWSAAPSGYTLRTSVATEVALLTKDSTTTDGAVTQSLTASASSGYRGTTVEILPLTT